MLRRVLVILACCAVSLPRPAPALAVGGKSAFSASLLYIYATDSSFWPALTGKLLRDGDTMLILPGVVYKVWCEVLPEGRPRIFANHPGVIAHQPLPWKTMAHVELQRSLFRELNKPGSGSNPPKLWCDYTNGTNKLRTDVSIRPFSIANTTCDYSNLNGVASVGSLVNFTCSSWSGFPIPEHSCNIVRKDEETQLPAKIASVSRLSEGQLVTTFSMQAIPENHLARIECRTTQQIAYDGSDRGYKESRVVNVRPEGQAYFTLISQSTKRCEMILSGDTGVTVLCQSEGGKPETDHRCWINGTDEPLPLMARIQDSTYVTEAAFHNSWAYQGSTAICQLKQKTYYSKDFVFQIPGFRESEKSCRLSKRGETVEVSCHSGPGLPSSEHSCVMHLDNRTTELPPRETTAQGGSVRSRYLVPEDSQYRGSQIACTIRQNAFRPKTFLYSMPRFTESIKSCRFTNTSREVRAVCEFTAGYPETRAECQLQMTSSSVSLSLKQDQEKVDLAAQSFSISYTVKLPAPEFSHVGGRLVCRVYQGPLFAQTFVHRIAEYRKPQPKATPPQLKATSLQQVTTPPQSNVTSPQPKETQSQPTSVSLHPKSISPHLRSFSPNVQSISPQPKANPLPPPRQLVVERRAEVPRPAATPEPGGTTEEPPLRMSSHTAITLSLALLGALLLLLLMSLPIHAVRRYLSRRRRKSEEATQQSLLNATAESLPTVAAAPDVVRRVRLAKCPTLRGPGPSFALQAILTDVRYNRGFRAGRRDGIQDIDQYSMFEFACSDPARSARMSSALTDAQLLGQVDQNRRELFRFSM